MEEELNMYGLTDNEIWAAVLLLYPSFGPSEQNDGKDTAIYRALGDEGLTIYKTIFDNNNKKNIKKFFKDTFIRKLWPKIMTIANNRKMFFSKDPKQEILPSYCEITRKV
jgi:hypothetical protein